jgi:hypothetical protein
MPTAETVENLGLMERDSAFYLTVMFDDLFKSITADGESLMAMQPVLLDLATPPSLPGVYMLLIGDDIMYVGEAKARKGLRDRLLFKHLSGDEGHATQRAFALDFPDRVARRNHIRSTVSVRWILIDDLDRVSVVERALIWLHRPPWNRK